MPITAVPVLGLPKAMTLHCHRRLHRVPDHVACAGLSQDIAAHCGSEWFAVLMFADGHGTARGPGGAARTPQKDQVDKMIAMAIALNKAAYFDGHWVIAWAPDRIHALWRDADGDLQFDVVFDEPWVRCGVWSVEEFAERAVAGYFGWREAMRRVDRQTEPTIKAALGQRGTRTLH